MRTFSNKSVARNSLLSPLSGSRKHLFAGERVQMLMNSPQLDPKKLRRCRSKREPSLGPLGRHQVQIILSDHLWRIPALVGHQIDVLGLREPVTDDCEDLHGRNPVADLRSNQGFASALGLYTNTRTDFRLSGSKRGASWRSERRAKTCGSACKWPCLSWSGGMCRNGGIGASEGIRTLDIHVGNVTLYQTELRSLPRRLAKTTGIPLKCKSCFPGRRSFAQM